MRVVGLIGGMSWESSHQYYRLLNETVRNRTTPLTNAKSLMYTVNFAEIEALQHAGRWDEAGAMMIDAAQRLERGGAECVVLCTNTMHKLADAITVSVQIPLLHIADATAKAVKAAGIERIGLLGTAFTMEQDFYKGRLTNNFGLEVITPEKRQRERVHRIIYDELCAGVIRDSSRAEYVAIMENLVARGAQGMILGCTEIMLLVSPADCHVPTFDTTALHALAAADFALSV